MPSFLRRYCSPMSAIRVTSERLGGVLQERSDCRRYAVPDVSDCVKFVQLDTNKARQDLLWYMSSNLGLWHCNMVTVIASLLSACIALEITRTGLQVAHLSAPCLVAHGFSPRSLSKQNIRFYCSYFGTSKYSKICLKLGSSNNQTNMRESFDACQAKNRLPSSMNAMPN